MIDKLFSSVVMAGALAIVLFVSLYFDITFGIIGGSMIGVGISMVVSGIMIAIDTNVWRVFND